MSVLNRKMFNRGARKELRKKGGIEDVQHFRNAGRVVGQVGSGIPGAELGRTFMAPYTQVQQKTKSNLMLNPLATLLKKASEKGLGSLGPIEQGILSSLNISNLGDKIIKGNTSGTTAESIGRNIVGGAVKYGAAIPGIPGGIISSLFTGPPELKPDDSPVKVDKDGKRIFPSRTNPFQGFGKRAGALVPDKELMESYGFQFFPTSGEELERFKRMQTIKQDNEKRDAAVEKQKLDLASNDAIQASLAASAQKEGKSTLSKAEKDFIESIKGTTVDVDPKTGNVKVLDDPSKPGSPFGERSLTEEEVNKIAGEGPGSTLDFDLGEDENKVITDVTKKSGELDVDGAADATVDAGKAPEDDGRPSDPKPKLDSPEQVKKEFGAKSDQEKKNIIDQSIEEFKSRAPKYEGIDKGILLMNIGFKIASGESPSAVKNIADGFLFGSKIAMEDKKEQNAFKRQIDLAALKHGITQDATIKAERRALENTFDDYVVGEKSLTYKGKEYKQGDTITFSRADKKDGLLPAGIRDKSVYNAAIKALAEDLKNKRDIIKDALEAKTINIDKADGFITDYSNLVSKAIESESARQIFTKAIFQVNKSGEVVGLKPALKLFFGKGKSFFGMSNDQEFSTLSDFKANLKAGLQRLVPISLGKDQSANSISDRDVNLLVEGYIADGILTSAGGGVFSLAFKTEQELTTSLQNGLTKIEESQAKILSDLASKEKFLSQAISPFDPKQSGLSLVEDQLAERERVFPTTTVTPTFTYDAENKIYRKVRKS